MLVPVPSGRAYRVASPAQSSLVIPALASELQRVLERFAREAGRDESRPVEIFFRPGIFGHHQVGRAADIYAVGGLGLDEWKQRWDRAPEQTSDPQHCRIVVQREQMNNLGWRLYKALQRYGKWSQPYGYPIQLFGPWTRREGPWKYISDRLLKAHRDHIHVAL